MTHSLLQPRYIVGQDYPNSPFRVGDILVNYKGNHYIRLSDEQIFTERYPQEFPNIFRRLNWHEYREIGEMPRWVNGKHKDDKRAIKRIIEVDWSIKDGELMVKQSIFNDSCWFKFSDHNLTPATEEEYLNYLKTKQ